MEERKAQDERQQKDETHRREEKTRSGDAGDEAFEVWQPNRSMTGCETQTVTHTHTCLVNRDVDGSRVFLWNDDSLTMTVRLRVQGHEEHMGNQRTISAVPRPHPLFQRPLVSSICYPFPAKRGRRGKNATEKKKDNTNNG